MNHRTTIHITALSLRPRLVSTCINSSFLVSNESNTFPVFVAFCTGKCSKCTTRCGLRVISLVAHVAV